MAQERRVGIVLSNGQTIEAPVEIWISAIIQTMDPDTFGKLITRVDEMSKTALPVKAVGSIPLFSPHGALQLIKG